MNDKNKEAQPLSIEERWSSLTSEIRESLSDENRRRFDGFSEAQKRQVILNAIYDGHIHFDNVEDSTCTI